MRRADSDFDRTLHPKALLDNCNWLKGCAGRRGRRGCSNGSNSFRQQQRGCLISHCTPSRSLLSFVKANTKANAYNNKYIQSRWCRWWRIMMELRWGSFRADLSWRVALLARPSLAFHNHNKCSTSSSSIHNVEFAPLRLHICVKLSEQCNHQVEQVVAGSQPSQLSCGTALAGELQVEPRTKACCIVCAIVRT